MNRGPLYGEPEPIHGGRPTVDGCNGCTDCCHLPEIMVTDDEADHLREQYAQFDDPLGELVIRLDPTHEGWSIMQGPCVFRRYDHPLEVGGCRIFGDRPAICEIFTCAFRTELRRAI